MTNATLQFRYVYGFIILGANIQIDCTYVSKMLVNCDF